MSDYSNESIKQVTLKDLFSHYRIVIPEIQREYVWGSPEIGGEVLENFFEDLIKNLKEFLEKRRDLSERSGKLEASIRSAIGESIRENDDCKKIDEAIRECADRIAERSAGPFELSRDSHAGFAYAYIPGYANASSGDSLPAYLIDGQQRTTTFFLILLYLSRKSSPEAMKDFLSMIGYREDGEDGDGGILSFCFRVRQQTQDFLFKLVKEVASHEEFDFGTISDRSWLLSDYKADVSIQAMVNTLRKWDERWRSSGLDAERCRDYVENHIRFWLYVVNETAQGEQLYITMNGRGCNLSRGEIIRAKVFNEVVKSKKNAATDVGKLFENLYDFFWKKRGKAQEPDGGVQKFLQWVYVLKNWETPEKSQFCQWALENKDAEGKGAFVLKEQMFELKPEGISADDIGMYFYALKYLDDQCTEDEIGSPLKNALKLDSQYCPIGNIQDFRKDSFVLLPILWLLSKCSDGSENGFVYSIPDNRKNLLEEELPRIAHFLRSQCSRNDISDSGQIIKALELLEEFSETVRSGPSPSGWAWLMFIDNHPKTAIVSVEEKYIARGLLSVGQETERRQFEELIWKIQDFSMESLKGDCQISGFLKANDSWSNPDLVWTLALHEEYRRKFDHFESFMKLREREPLRSMIWMMNPEHRGYDVWGIIHKRSWQELFRDSKFINGVDALESKINEKSELEALDETERQFLERYRESENNHLDRQDGYLIRSALALLTTRLVVLKKGELGQRINFDAETQIQFNKVYVKKAGRSWKQDPQEEKEHGFKPLGGLYFWQIPKIAKDVCPTCFQRDYLLACHKAEQCGLDLNGLVDKFISEGTSGHE